MKIRPLAIAALIALLPATGYGGAQVGTAAQPATAAGSAAVGILGETAPAGRQADAPQLELPAALRGLRVGGLFYLAWQGGKRSTGAGFSQFVLNRGYLDVQKTVSSHLAARYTTDITRDATGDWKTRIKYLYGRFDLAGGVVLSGLGLEFGQVHNPWLDFEESINGFRMQGTMFLERNNIFNSADVGVVVGSDLGGKVDEAYRGAVSNSYAGRYGTWQLGLYNGGGYHASEANVNKVIEGRLTLRPLPDVAPGLQLSALGVTGKGNLAVDPPEFQVFDGMLSFQSATFTATAQYYRGTGSGDGTAVVAAGGPGRRQDGWSAFGAVHLLAGNRLSLIGRYDRFDGNRDDPNNDVQKRAIGGIAYAIHKGDVVLVDYDHVDHTSPGLASDRQAQVTLQLAF